jgi:hypothetical protein
VGIPVAHQLAHIELVGVFRQVGLVAHGVHVCAVISATQLSTGHGARRVHSAGPRRSGSLFDWVYVCVSRMRVGGCVCVCVRVGAHAALNKDLHGVDCSLLARRLGGAHSLLPGKTPRRGRRRTLPRAVRVTRTARGSVRRGPRQLAPAAAPGPHPCAARGLPSSRNTGEPSDSGFERGHLQRMP